MDPLILGIIVLAGIVRGVSGFGGAMLIAPPLSILLDPVSAVVHALALEAVAAVAVVPWIWRMIEARTLLMIGLPALLAIPFGGWLLVTLDAELIGTLLAVTVIGFSTVLMMGFRHKARPKPGPAAAVGAASGLLFGATSMGGPPVILYLLAGPADHTTTRANLMVFISAACAVALILPWQAGHVDRATATGIGLLILPYLGGIWLGTRLFPLIDERLFRRLTLVFMIGVSVFALVA
ncbi:MAG: sulfite exporter TauE/SafE family protein [Pikeienuella sp.]